MRTPVVDEPLSAESYMKESLVSLAKDFYSRATSGQIEIKDIQDARALVSMLKDINDMQVNSSDTPQITADVINFYAKESKLPEGTEPNSIELEQTIGEMTSSDIEKLVEDRAKDLNDKNSETFQKGCDNSWMVKIY